MVVTYKHLDLVYKLILFYLLMRLWPGGAAKRGLVL